MINVEAMLGLYFDVNVTQMDMSKSSLHISIETSELNLSLFASKEQIREFIKKLEESLDEYEELTNS
jgi:hypothetical protein